MNKLEAYYAQLEAERSAREERRAERRAFIEQAQARREAFARGELPATSRASIPRLAQLYRSDTSAKEAFEKQQADVTAGPYAFSGRGLALPPGSKFAPSTDELVNHG